MHIMYIFTFSVNGKDETSEHENQLDPQDPSDTQLHASSDSARRNIMYIYIHF